jgi:hypothetical protein
MAILIKTLGRMSAKIIRILVVCLMTQGLPLMSYDIFSEKGESEGDKPLCWVNEVRNKVTRKYVEKYGLTVSGVVDSASEGVIHEIGVHFRIHKLISKQKARQIVVECTQDFIKELNNHPHLKPYFKNYPCTAKNINIYLFIFHPDGEMTYFPDLGVTSTRNGTIEFDTNDPKHQVKYKTYEVETFEEGVERLKFEIAKEGLS